jgi:LacI family transcriptional regulator
MGKKATIRDVAKQAGVSVASVSYVLNGIEKITSETKERILSAIDQLDYKPSLTARCLSKGDSKLIGISLPITEKGDIPGVLLENNPFFGEFISGIEYTTRNKGYDILISGVDTNEQYKDWIQRRRLDGIIMLGVYPHSIFEEINKLDIPIVLTDAYENYAADFHRVMVEDEIGGYLATKHLIDCGHVSIAFAVGSIKNSYTNYYRYLGYKRALKEAGIKAKSKLVFEDHVTFHGGYRIGRKLLNTDQKITAVFAAADIMAIGIMKSIIESGKQIPKDLSVIGFDDIKFGQYTTPGLTTIRQDIIMKGRVSAEMIMDDLANGKRTNHSLVLQPELVIRESTDFIQKI